MNLGEITKLKNEIETLKRKIQMLRHTKLQSIEEIDSQNRVFNENQKLKVEIEEYKKSGLACIRGAKTLPNETYLQLEDIECKFQKLQKDSKQAIEIVKRLKDRKKLADDRVSEAIEMKPREYNDFELHLSCILHSILKGDKK